MKLTKRWTMALAGTVIAATIALGATATFAQEPGTATPTAPAQSAPGARGERGGFFGLGGHRGGPRGGLGPNEEALAEALGITVEELEAAKEEARAAALEQAVAEGRITQEEADQIQSGEGGPGFRHHGPRGDKGEMDEFLADALGITVEELEAAKSEAHEQALADAVAEGRITQEQADLMAAGRALHDYIDREAILAEVLGMSVEELEAAKAEGQRLPEIIEAQGLDEASFQEAMQAAHEAAVQEAIADGVITQEQADQLQENGGFFGRGGRHGFGAPRGPRFDQQQAPTTPSNDS